MAKVRVYELAKELGLESKALLTKLQELGEFVKSASSTLEPPVVRRMRDLYPNATPAVESAAPAPAKKAAAKKSAKKAASSADKSDGTPSAEEISALLAELGPLVPPHLQDLAQRNARRASANGANCAHYTGSASAFEWSGYSHSTNKYSAATAIASGK